MTSTALAVDLWNPPGAPARPGTALEALVQRYGRDLKRYAYWLARDHHVAEDLVQETWLRAWRSLDRLQNPAAAKGWLLTILRRENARRFERERPATSDLSPEELGDHHRVYDTSTEAFVLRQALDGLAPEYREPLLLQVLHGYSQQEIAARLGLSAAGAGTRLFRARQKLRAVLDGEQAAA
jgi:RNA polymerase sigma-70 factor (ECF subfamily)